MKHRLKTLLISAALGLPAIYGSHALEDAADVKSSAARHMAVVNDLSAHPDARLFAAHALVTLGEEDGKKKAKAHFYKVLFDPGASTYFDDSRLVSAVKGLVNLGEGPLSSLYQLRHRTLRKENAFIESLRFPEYTQRGWFN